MKPTSATTKKTLKGTVVSDKMDKTAVVAVTRFVKHAKYKKYFKITKKYKVHDENNAVHTGDKVEIVETRPISKDKHFAIAQ
ncbi:MAG: ribosomal protein small subunit ribosomal protein [Candidatus Nomurabacteria bacterium]|nr:ribosomal protein small subunit ribosomal protein [Candidatus Nomurabacteria bacterium]